MVRCAVLGSPIGHSLSPALHRAAYAALGLDWTYDAVEVDEAGLDGFLAALGPDWRGLSLTMPLKRTVLPLLDSVDPWAEVSGAANTVVLEDGRRLGANTDVPGAVSAISERWAGPSSTAVVLGGGATAASVLLALSELGCSDAVVLVRDPARARDTVDAVARHGRGPTIEVGRITDDFDEVDVLVSTIPARAQTPELVDRSGRAGLVFEVLYEPWPTPLAAAAVEGGRALVTGLDLLVHQASLQVRLMTGRDASVVTLRAAGERALAERAGGEQQ